MVAIPSFHLNHIQNNTNPERQLKQIFIIKRTLKLETLKFHAMFKRFLYIAISCIVHNTDSFIIFVCERVFDLFYWNLFQCVLYFVHTVLKYPVSC